MSRYNTRFGGMRPVCLLAVICMLLSLIFIYDSNDRFYAILAAWMALTAGLFLN